MCRARREVKLANSRLKEPFCGCIQAAERVSLCWSHLRVPDRRLARQLSLVATLDECGNGSRAFSWTDI